MTNFKVGDLVRLNRGFYGLSGVYKKDDIGTIIEIMPEPTKEKRMTYLLYFYDQKSEEWFYADRLEKVNEEER